jgi:PIN domain nuclease of toxin-antitoxin system
LILLDTHVWLWLATSPHRLSSAATSAIQAASSSGGVAIASVSLIELAVLMSRGRLQLEGSPEMLLPVLIERTGAIVKDITPAIAAFVTHGPDAAGFDPVDRLLVATARVEGIPLVTRDRKLRAQHVVQTVW